MADVTLLAAEGISLLLVLRADRPSTSIDGVADVIEHLLLGIPRTGFEPR
jgi:hypothetical protein